MLAPAAECTHQIEEAGWKRRPHELTTLQ